MIFKFKTESGWNFIDNIDKFQITDSEDRSTNPKYRTICYTRYNDDSEHILTIENDAYLMNDNSKTIEKIK